MSTRTVTAHNFAASTDEQIIAAARERLRRRDRASLRPCLRRLLTTGKPDVYVAGKFLWADLCGWRDSA